MGHLPRQGFAAALLALMFILSPAPTVAKSGEVRILLEDFTRAKPGDFPKGWRARDERGRPNHRVLEEDGNRFLRADVKADSVHVYRRVSWNLNKHPRVAWRWRVHRFPDNGNEQDPALNDTAAGVYVTWVDVLRRRVRSIKYLWSAKLPQGTEFKVKTTWFVVVRSGTEGIGEWFTHEADVAADYERLWERKVENPDLIMVLTDANATGTQAVCDYDDFEALAPTPDAGGGE